MDSRERGKRILVVEDNPKNMKLVTDLLAYRGHRVLTAVDGESGIEKAVREVPDLILMDIQLPGLDGLSATARLKSDDRTASIPVLAVTAHALRGDSRKIRLAGCDGYITKPIRTREFIRIVEEALRIEPSKEKNEKSMPAPEMEETKTGGTVLAVDDEDRNRRLIEATLSPLGIRVVQAASGEEALRVIAEDPPDLVLLDLMMPGMDGLETARRIRANAETRHLPIVLLTAFADAERKLQGIEAGCDDFIAKPFDRIELTARIRSLIRVSFYRTQMANSKKFDTVFQETGDGVVLLDGEYRVEAVNDSAARLLEIPGGTPDRFDLIDHMYTTRHISIEKSELLDPEQTETRFEVRRDETKETGILVLDGALKKIHGPGGAVATAVLTLKDVTRRWTDDRLKENFLSGISHKLKTPLAVILANNESFLSGYLGKVSEEQEEALRDMFSAGQELLSHMNKLISFASPDLFAPSNRAQEPLDAFLECYMDGMKTRYEKQGVRVTLDGDPRSSELSINSAAVSLALDNLVENAVKFAGNKELEIAISARRISEGWLEFSVEDNGRGIPPEEIDRVFERFYQVEKYHTGMVAGAGLGLPLARRIVEGMGGTIRVRSRLGDGSTFSFTVPSASLEKLS